jgi:hypothetical protein
MDQSQSLGDAAHEGGGSTKPRKRLQKDSRGPHFLECEDWLSEVLEKDGQ